MQGSGTAIYSNHLSGTQPKIQPTNTTATPILPTGTKKPLPPQKSVPPVPSPKPANPPTTISNQVTLASNNKPTTLSAVPTMQIKTAVIASSKLPAPASTINPKAEEAKINGKKTQANLYLATGLENSTVTMVTLPPEELQRKLNQAISDPSCGLQLMEVINDGRDGSTPVFRELRLAPGTLAQKNQQLQTHRSEQELKDVLKQNPLDLNATVELGTLYEKTKKIQEATTLLETALLEAKKTQNAQVGARLLELCGDLICRTSRDPKEINRAGHCYLRAAQLDNQKTAYYKAKAMAAGKDRDTLLAAAKK